MDRLVAVDVKQLDLRFRPSDRRGCSAAVIVTNVMHTMSVAVSLSTTRPHLFTVGPDTPSLLPPLSSATFVLTLAPLDRPPVTSTPDLLLVRSAIFPVPKPDATALRRLFTRPGAHVFKDASIPIFFVGPHVLDALLLSAGDDETLENPFLISTAVKACSVQDLSALLRRSAAARKSSFVSALVDAGAHVDARGSDGRSALCLAVSSGSLDAVRVLVTAGASIDLKLDRVFHEAAGANRTDLISVLEKASRSGSVWAGSVDSGGRTPVHYAAANGHVDAVKVCLESGAGDPDRTDWAGWTPLHCAADGGFLDVVKFLIERSEFDPKIAVTFDGKKTPLDLAVDAGHSHLYDVLGLGDRLLRAASVGDVGRVRDCISRGVGVNGTDQNGWTALHRAAFGGWIEAVRVLIGNGAHLDAVDDVGFMPLRCAVEAGHAEAALLLVGHVAHARLKGLKGADLFAMKLDSCGANACSLLSLGDDQVIETRHAL